MILDNVIEWGFGCVQLTSVTGYTNRDILVSRDASALTGSVSVDLGFPAAGVLLPSNLVDTTDLKSFTQEVRLASDYDSPFQRSEEHTSELQSLMRISYAVFCLKKKNTTRSKTQKHNPHN